MNKRIIAVIMLAAVLLGVLAGCQKEKGPVTAEEAKQIVIDHTGAESKEISDIHVHIEENDAGEVCYSIHITVRRVEYTYVVHGMTGEILSVTEGGH